MTVCMYRIKKKLHCMFSMFPIFKLHGQGHNAYYVLQICLHRITYCVFVTKLTVFKCFISQDNWLGKEIVYPKAA